MYYTSNLLLRWTIGSQDTTSLSDFDTSQYHDAIWLCKLSIVSFQKWFPNAQFVVGYNGNNFKEFQELIHASSPEFTQNVKFIDQHSSLNSGEIENPYHFWPGAQQKSPIHLPHLGKYHGQQRGRVHGTYGRHYPTHRIVLHASTLFHDRSRRRTCQTNKAIRLSFELCCAPRRFAESQTDSLRRYGRHPF